MHVAYKLWKASAYNIAVWIIKTILFIGALLTVIVLWNTLTPHSWRWLDLEECSGLVILTILLDAAITSFALFVYTGNSYEKYY